MAYNVFDSIAPDLVDGVQAIAAFTGNRPRDLGRVKGAADPAFRRDHGGRSGRLTMHNEQQQVAAPGKGAAATDTRQHSSAGMSAERLSPADDGCPSAMALIIRPDELASACHPNTPDSRAHVKIGAIPTATSVENQP